LDEKGARGDFELRQRFAEDLFENQDSPIYWNRDDFPLPFKVKPNDPNYNDAMNTDFFAIWILIVQDIENKFWESIDDAFQNYSENDGLPPFDKWTDSSAAGNDAIYQRLTFDPPDSYDNYPYRKEVILIHRYKNNWTLNWDPQKKINFSSFSTNKNDKVGDMSYANPDFIMKIFGTTYASSDIFTSIYAYNQKPYYDATSLTVFWSIFALILFGATSLIYSRTDIK
jgi:hypothetical protein